MTASRGFVAGLRAVRRAPLDQLVAITTIAVALMLGWGFRLLSRDAAQLASGFGRGVQMTVYLDDDAPPGRARQIAETLQRFPEVDRVEAVESREAYRRLRESLGDQRDLLEGVEETMLPASLEVTLKQGTADLARMHPAVEKLRRTAGVSEVELQGEWVERLSALERLLHAAALLFGALVAGACLYIVASTIRLRVVGRRDEIEILKLVGATDGFVRAPFLVEGTLQGAAGAAMALATLYALFRAAAPWAERTLGGALCAAPLRFLPPVELGLAVAAGALLGLVGSALAVNRHLHA